MTLYQSYFAILWAPEKCGSSNLRTYTISQVSIQGVINMSRGTKSPDFLDEKSKERTSQF